MMITRINKVLNEFKFFNEEFINLQQLYKLVNKDFKIEMEQVTITPFYIQNGKRYEIYYLEFCCRANCTYEDYILALTGKKQLNDVSKEILDIRKKCFSLIDEPCKLKEYIEFVFNNKELHDEIIQMFGSYSEENLYITIYEW